MARRTRLAALLVPVAAVATLALGITPAAAAARSYTVSVTVTVSQTASYTSSESAPVTATASWGLPAITKTASDTASATATDSSTQSATVTWSGTGNTPDNARATATAWANWSATLQAYIAAVTQASINAAIDAHTKLVAQMISLQTSLYAQALADAKAAVVARDAAQAPSTTPDAPVTNCGATITKADGTPWTCTFDDEFTGTALDTSKWTAWDNVNWWGDSNMCFESEPDHVSVADGALNLTVSKNTAGATCRTPNGITTPAYLGANLTTKNNFSQEYGRFEARIKYSGTQGVHNNFWLYADENASNGAEIDIAEAWGAQGDQMVGATHVAGKNGGDAGDWNTCGMPNFSAGYHTYAVEWTPQTVTFIYDDNACTSWTIDRSTFSDPAAFDQKLFMILTTMTDDGTYAAAPDASSTFPATTQVDWVRVWK